MEMKKLNRLFPIMLLIVGSLQAQTNLAVVEFAGKNVSAEEASALTDRLRIELFRTGAFTVVERERMDAILKEQGFQISDCTSDQCMVELGQLIGVQQIVAGSVMRVGNVYSIAARIISVEKGDLVRTAIFDHEGQIGDLLKFGMKDVALQLSGTKSAEPQTSPATKSVIAEEPTTSSPPSIVSTKPRQTSPQNRSIKGRIGVLSALNSTTIFGDGIRAVLIDDLEPKPHIGTAFGAFGLFPISNFLYLRPEFMYIRKGFTKQENTESRIENIWAVNFDYLSIPFLVQINLPLSPGIEFYCIFGAAGNYLVNAREIVTFNDKQISDRNIKNSFRSGESSMIMGFGTEINLRFLVEFRADIGLISINGEYDSSTSNEVKNSAVGILLGYCF